MDLTYDGRASFINHVISHVPEHTQQACQQILSSTVQQESPETVPQELLQRIKQWVPILRNHGISLTSPEDSSLDNTPEEDLDALAARCMPEWAIHDFSRARAV